MTFALLIYRCCTGMFSICKIRRENKELLSTAFHRVLELGTAARVLKIGELTAATDATRIIAKFSKHISMSHDRIVEQIQLAGDQINDLLAEPVGPVGPVFGIIKGVLGFRRFMLCGKMKAGLEWTLVSTAFNFKRLLGLGARLRPT